MELRLKNAAGGGLLLIVPSVFAADPASASNPKSESPCTPYGTNVVNIPPDPTMVATLVIVSLTLGILVGWFARSIGRTSQVG